MSRALVSILVVALAAGPASSQSTREQAKEHFMRGVDLFNKGELARALPEFEGSYQLNPVPEVLFNIALVHRGMGRYADAVRALRRFLQESQERTTPLSPKRRSDAQAAIAEIRTHMGTLLLSTSPPGAIVKLDGSEPTFEGALLFLDPGVHRIEVSADGHVAAREDLTVNAGKTITHRVELRREAGTVAIAPAHEPPPRPAPALELAAASVATTTSPPRRPVYKRWWVWTPVGVVVAAGVAIGLGVGLTEGRGPSTDGAVPIHFTK